MKKTRFNHRLAMEMKYGQNWNQPNRGVSVNNATLEKAEIFHEYNKTNDIAVLRARVLSAFINLGEATDNDVSRYLKRVYHIDVPSSTVSARRDELIKKEKMIAVLDEYGNKKKKFDPITENKNVLWRAIKDG